MTDLYCSAGAYCLHVTTNHKTTQHTTPHIAINSAKLRHTHVLLHCTTLHYTTQVSTTHSSVPYTTPHHTTPHCITLIYTTPHYTINRMLQHLLSSKDSKDGGSTISVLWNMRDNVKYVQNRMAWILDLLESLKNIFTWVVPYKVRI